jgi:hypothetical protein
VWAIGAVGVNVRVVRVCGILLWILVLGLDSNCPDGSEHDMCVSTAKSVGRFMILNVH